jgi:NTP pyrophosphatase (non-canonical NTP hydrolase)
MIYMSDGPEQREAQAEAEAVANFIPDALRTCSPNFHGDKVTISQLIAAIQAGIAAANRLDRMKKALFYGRDYVENDARPQVTVAEASENAAMIIGGVMPVSRHVDTFAYEQLFHAILGNFTEAGEQLEAWLKTYLFGGEIDAVNMREEFGDNLWYLAIGMNAVERMTGETCDFETEMARVINKLKQRFPDKFTADAANNRDLAAERAVLEGGEKTSD